MESAQTGSGAQIKTALGADIKLKKFLKCRFTTLLKISLESEGASRFFLLLSLRLFFKVGGIGLQQVTKL